MFGMFVHVNLAAASNSLTFCNHYTDGTLKIPVSESQERECIGQVQKRHWYNTQSVHL